MKKIKIAHVVPSFDVGGLENGIVNLINNMDGDQFQHVLYVLNGKATARARIIKNIEVQLLEKKPGNDITIPFKLSHFFTEYKPDVIRTYAWGSWLEGLLGGILYGSKCIIHSEHGFIINNLCKTPLRRRVAQYIAAKFTTKIIAVSTSIKESLIAYSWISEEKILVINNGVDTEKFKPSRNNIKFRKKYGLPKETCLIGIVARLDPVKDIGTAIYSIKELSDVHIFIVGAGSELDKLETLSKENSLDKRVHFLGERNDVSFLLNEFDLYVLTSLREGTSNSLLEAMATGLPIIATNVGGNRFLIDDGKTGYLINPKDHKALEAHIRNFSSSRNEFIQIGKDARNKVIGTFSLIEMVKKYDELYKSFLVKH